jgi:hypothetical protein
MPSCEEMEKGQVYECAECGLQLQVVSECKTCGTSPGCGCPRTFTCGEKGPALKPTYPSPLWGEGEGEGY